MNQHHKDANELLTTMPDKPNIPERIAQAQVEATLAVAYELRTANLLAAVQLAVTPQPAMGMGAGETAAFQQAWARL